MEYLDKVDIEIRLSIEIELQEKIRTATKHTNLCIVETISQAINRTELIIPKAEKR